MTKPIETYLERQRIDNFRFIDIYLTFTKEIEKIDRLIIDNWSYLNDCNIEDFRKMKSDLETIFLNLPNYFEDIEFNIWSNQREMTYLDVDDDD